MEIVVADDEEEAASATRAGRPRASWSHVCTESLPEPATLRKAAQEWLNNHNVIHTTLTASSKNREPALIARCGKCVDCTHQHCFSWSGDQQLQVEQRGECNDRPHLARLKRLNAKKFASTDSPLRALKAMRQAGIPLNQLPSTQPTSVNRAVEKQKS